MKRVVVLFISSLLLVACSTQRSPAPIEDRTATGRPVRSASAVARPVAAVAPDGQPLTYVVKKGDTLYRIALDHGLTYRDLAAWNDLNDVNDIKVDQVLRLTSPDEPRGAESRPAGGESAVVVTPMKSSSAPVASGSVETKVYPKAVVLPYSDQAAASVASKADNSPTNARVASKQHEASKPVSVSVASGVVANSQENSSGYDSSGLEWVWPTAGKPLRGYTESSKGIDIPGKMGQPVIAAASGKVVYAGSGLQGYGNLVIIKHNKELLSVYAHNRKLLVGEGDSVKKGEKIAEMGNSDADQVKLHFEIRKFGKPVDPNRYITTEKS